MKYGEYIFSAYVFAAVILLALIVQSILAWRKVKDNGDA